MGFSREKPASVPKRIQDAVILYGLSLFVSPLVGLLYSKPESPLPAGLAPLSSSSIVRGLLIACGMTAIAIWLLYQIAAAKNWARLGILGLTVADTVTYVPGLRAASEQHPWIVLLDCAALFLAVAGVALLFTGEAQLWFTGKNKT